MRLLGQLGLAETVTGAGDVELVQPGPPKAQLVVRAAGSSTVRSSSPAGVKRRTAQPS